MAKLSPLCLLLSSPGCYMSMMYEDTYYSSKSLVSMKNGQVDLSKLHFLSKVTEDMLAYSDLYGDKPLDIKQDKQDWVTSTIKMAVDCHMEGSACLIPTLKPDSLQTIDHTTLSLE